MSDVPAVAVDALLRHGDFTLDVSFTAESGITALWGPSGAGKTTVLHLIAGLLRPERGRISVRGRVIVETDRGAFVPPHRRRVGLVFQDAQLFPHLTVGQNISFARWFAPAGSDLVDPRLVIDTLGIEALIERRPSRLSGGEKQRVALARSILSFPDLLLLDEPLAGLDDDRRLEILPLIGELNTRLTIPMIYVTHRADEVMRLASRVVRLERGKVVAAGAPSDILAGMGGAGQIRLPPRPDAS